MAWLKCLLSTHGLKNQLCNGNKVRLQLVNAAERGDMIELNHLVALAHSVSDTMGSVTVCRQLLQLDISALEIMCRLNNIS